MRFNYNCNEIDQRALFSGRTPGDSTSKEASNQQSGFLALAGIKELAIVCL